MYHPARLSVAPRSRPLRARTRGGRAPRRRRHDARQRTAQRDHWRSGRHGAESGCGCCCGGGGGGGGGGAATASSCSYSYVATRTRSGSTNGGPPAAPEGSAEAEEAHRAAASSPHAPPVPAPPAGAFPAARPASHRGPPAHDTPAPPADATRPFRRLPFRRKPQLLVTTENRQNKRRGCGAFFHLMIRRTTRM